MYWRCGIWTPIEDDKAKTIVTELGEELAKSQGRQLSLLLYCRNATTEMGPCSSSNEKPITKRAETSPTEVVQCRLVRTVAYRTLPFYPHDQDWRLYRFTCPIDPDKSDELDGYLPEAAFFAVRGPGDTSTPRWTLLDWTSTPLHRLNSMATLDLGTLGKRLDYLLLFVSYLGSTEERDGLIHPFIIPDSPHEIFNPVSESNKWAPSAIDGTSSWLPSFEKFAENQGLRLFKARDFGYDLPAHRRSIDSFDIPWERQPISPNHAIKSDQSAQSIHKIVEDFFEKKSLDWFLEISDQPNGDRSLFQLKAPMTYRGALFEATFSLDEDGMVLRVKNDPVSEADWLPAPRWEVHRRPDGIPLLCLQAPRREWSVDKLLQKVDAAESKSDEPIVKSNKRITKRI